MANTFSNYSVGDFLIRIKNTAMAKNKTLEYKAEKQIVAVAEALKKLGFLDVVKKSRKAGSSPAGEKEVLTVTLAYKNRINSPNRTMYPLKRVDWDPNGERNPQNRGISKYKRISWDEASEIIAEHQDTEEEEPLDEYEDADEEAEDLDEDDDEDLDDDELDEELDEEELDDDLDDDADGELGDDADDDGIESPDEDEK